MLLKYVGHGVTQFVESIIASLGCFALLCLFLWVLVRVLVEARVHGFI